MRGYIRLLRAVPWLSGPLMRSEPRRYAKDADKAFARQFGALCEADRAALEDPRLRQNLLESAVEALASGHRGVAAESQLLFVRPWGFSPAEVECHVELWYGDEDTLVPPDMGRYLDQTIPDSRLTIVPGAGHTLYLTRWTDILRSLLGSAG
jgi:pimeloyl-ACP methyl ester carboxylesterase